MTVPDQPHPGLGSAGRNTATQGPPLVTDFRQIVLWPVQLMPRHEGAQIQKHWELLERAGIDSVWKEVADEFTTDATQFSERHYREFVTFLPYVQRFLYGEGDVGGYGHSPIRVFRRADVAQARITFPGDPEPMLFGVAHVDLYFFYDIDVAILVVEIFAKDITLSRALDTLYRFGRAYPTHWEPSGRGGHCAERVEWISREGRVLAVSDYERRERYLSFVCQHRVPCVAFHWEYLLWPLVLYHSDQPGAVRYREIEYQRMPLMSYLALDDVTRLTRGDWVRLGLVTRPGDSETLPYSERFLQDFEYRYCYDRYWDQTLPHDWMNTRFICNGHAFTVIGSAGESFFTDAESGILGQFRHQFFLLGLIAHFHKASLLMLADRLVVAISRLDIRQPESIRVFKRSIRQTMEIFLRFTHRYWFHAVSDQAQARDLFTTVVAPLEDRRALRGGQTGNPGHDPLPGQRPGAPPGRDGGAADRGDDLRIGGEHRHRLLRHEPDRRSGQSAADEDRLLSAGSHPLARLHPLRRRQVEAAVRLPRCHVRRAARQPAQARCAPQRLEA